MKVLITGGTGRIGQYLVQELVKSHEITILSRQDMEIPGVRIAQGTLFDVQSLCEACRGQDAVIHLAGVPRPASSPRAVHTRSQVLETNVMGTENLLSACVRERVGKFILASTDAVLGFAYHKREVNFDGSAVAPSYFPIDEEHPCYPQDSYGLSKVLAERICRNYSEEFGVQTICLRISNVWYPTEAEMPEKFLVSAKLDADRVQSYQTLLDVPETDKWHFWTYSDARDVSKAFRLALENDAILHDVFFIPASDTDTSLPTAELLRTYWPDVPLKRELVGFEAPVSGEKAKRLLGYQPSYSWRDWPSIKQPKNNTK